MEQKTKLRQLRPKVFCIGLNKTGTTSFGDAMQMFGYERSGWTFSVSPRLVREYFEGNLNTIYNVAYRHDVLEDLPWPLVYKEMDEHFPNAKFVLTLRETPERWLSSISKHIVNEYEGHRKIYGYYHPRENEKAYLDKYDEHREGVEKYFEGRPEKLLTMCFEKGDGWGKLLPFLGLGGTPVAAWPHSNRAGTQYTHRQPGEGSQADDDG